MAFRGRAHLAGRGVKPVPLVTREATMQTERRREKARARYQSRQEAETPEQREARLTHDREARQRSKEEERQRKARLAAKLARWAEQNKRLGWG